MKKAILKALLFLLVNGIGFHVGVLLVFFGLSMDIFDPTDKTFSIEHMLFRMSLTWMVCAVFSFSYFFLKGVWRWIFLSAPIVVPLIYGILLIQPHL